MRTAAGHKLYIASNGLNRSFRFHNEHISRPVAPAQPRLVEQAEYDPVAVGPAHTSTDSPPPKQQAEDEVDSHQCQHNTTPTSIKKKCGSNSYNNKKRTSARVRDAYGKQLALPPVGLALTVPPPYLSTALTFLFVAHPDVNLHLGRSAVNCWPLGVADTTLTAHPTNASLR
jgi:hypothetical protein